MRKGNRYCGMTLGHGLTCQPGYQCGNCRLIEELQEHALTAMAVWEYLSQSTENAYLPFEWIGDVGAYEHRSICLELIAPAIDEAYEAFPEEAIDRMDLHAFDWEWIPLYIDTAVELGIAPTELRAQQDRIITRMLTE